jgi:hypothetical protein
VLSLITVVDCFWNAVAHARKADLVFRGKGRVHLNRWGRQFSRLLTAEVCASAVEMLDTPCSEVAWEYWLPTPFASFHFTSPLVRHRVPSGFNWTPTYPKYTGLWPSANSQYSKVSFCDGSFYDDSILRPLSSRTEHSRLVVHHCRNLVSFLYLVRF